MITDVIMPKLTGSKLVEKVEKIAPDMKTIFMSGYTADQLGNKELVDQKERRFIQKPFSHQAICQLIEELHRQSGLLI